MLLTRRHAQASAPPCNTDQHPNICPQMVAAGTKTCKEVRGVCAAFGDTGTIFRHGIRQSF
jgi:hypothetical protein